jgi:hypothetical protein
VQQPNFKETGERHPLRFLCLLCNKRACGIPHKANEGNKEKKNVVLRPGNGVAAVSICGSADALV